MGVSVQVVDAQACLDPVLFAEEIADRLMGPLVVSAIQHGEGEHRTLTLSAMNGERLLWSGEMSFVSGECAGIAAKAADKVMAGLVSCPERYPTERGVVREHPISGGEQHLTRRSARLSREPPCF